MNFFFENIIFILLLCFTVISSLFAVTNKNTIYSVLYLILSFIYVTILLLFLEADFIALVFILVYVGAISILFLFVVMMLNIKITNSVKKLFQEFPIGSLFGVILLFEISYIFLMSFQTNNYVFLKAFISAESYLNWLETLENSIYVETFGLVLYSYFFILLLLAGFILLIAIVGSVSLTIYKPEKKTLLNNKFQFIFKQVVRSNKKKP